MQKWFGVLGIHMVSYVVNGKQKGWELEVVGGGRGHIGIPA